LEFREREALDLFYTQFIRDSGSIFLDQGLGNDQKIVVLHSIPGHITQVPV